MPESPNRPTNRAPGVGIPGEHANEHNAVATVINNIYKKPIGTTKTAAFTVAQNNQDEIIPVNVSSLIDVTFPSLEAGTVIELIQTGSAGFVLKSSGMTFLPSTASAVQQVGGRARVTYLTSTLAHVEGNLSAAPASSLLSDTFTGTDGAAWNSTNWTRGLTPTAGGGTTIQTNTGRIQAGSVGAYSSNSRISERMNVGTISDFDLTFRFKFDTTEHYLYIVYRCNLTSLARDNCFTIQLSTQTSTLELDRTVSFSDTTVASMSNTFSNNGTWYRIRVRAFGTSHRIRVWNDGSAEPSTWGIDTTHAYTTAGSIGLAANSGSAAVVTQSFVDDVVLSAT